MIVIWVYSEVSYYLDKPLSVLDRFAQANSELPLQVLVVVPPSMFPESDTGPRNSVEDRIAEFRASRDLSVPFAILDDEDFAKLFGETSGSVRLVADHEGRIVHASLVSPDNPACLGLAQVLVDRLAESDAPGDASPREPGAVALHLEVRCLPRSTVPDWLIPGAPLRAR